MTRWRSIAWISAAVVLAGGSACLGAEGEGGHAKFNFGDLGESIATLVIFGGLLFVLGKWAWKPIVAQLKNREDVIAQKIRYAEETKVHAETFLVTSQAKIKEAEQEARDLMQQARKGAEEIRDRLLHDARDEADTVVENARRDIEVARVDALRDLQQTTAELASEIALEVLERDIDPAQQRRLLERSLDVIRGAAGGK